MIWGCLIVATTESQHPQGLAICERLIEDDMYLDRLSHLVRVPYRQLSLCQSCLQPCARIPIFHVKVQGP